MRRPVALMFSVLGLSGVMLTVGALTGGDRSEPQVTANSRAVAQPPQILAGGDLTGNIAALQQRLKRLPTDSAGWATLGSMYTAQTISTDDRSYYGKADGAFAKSLQAKPRDNAPALTGKAALAASRHDFGAALTLTQQSEGLNAYSSSNLGTMVDALTELGRYPQAFATLQRMVDLKPGVPSLTRVSYSHELRGDIDGARVALERALDVAQSPADKGFVYRYLGELAFNAGQLDTAPQQFTRGLQVYGLDQITTSYTELVSRTALTPGFALLAVLLAGLLGSLHAFAPGHGKTLMVAYLVGARARGARRR